MKAAVTHLSIGRGSACGLHIVGIFADADRVTCPACKATPVYRVATSRRFREAARDWARAIATNKEELG